MNGLKNNKIYEYGRRAENVMLFDQDHYLFCFQDMSELMKE